MLFFSLLVHPLRSSNPNLVISEFTCVLYRHTKFILCQHPMPTLKNYLIHPRSHNTVNSVVNCEHNLDKSKIGSYFTALLKKYLHFQ